MNPNSSTLILGLGNTLLTDDGVGVYAARRASELIGTEDIIDIKEAEIAGFALLDLLEGYDRAIIIDALNRPGHSPGEISIHSVDDFSSTSHLTTGHQIDLPTAVELGKQLDRTVPRKIRIVCVQVADDRTLGEQCTPAVEKAIEPAAKLAVEIARDHNVQRQ